MQLIKPSMFYSISAFRFFLAIQVAVYHLWREIAPDAGRVAVAGFFLISGYLISFILNDVYKDRIGDFFKNRVLRIYPLYLFSLSLGLIAIYFYPEQAQLINKSHHIPESFKEWFSNITIFGLYGDKVRIIAPAWSLNTEIIFYLAFPIIAILSKKQQLNLFKFSILLSVLAIINFVPFGFYGHYLGSASIFIGGFLLFSIKLPKKLISKKILILSIIAYLLLSLLIPLVIDEYLGGRHRVLNRINILLAMLPCALFIKLTSHFDLENKALQNISSFLGNLSYPIFLLHQISAIFYVVLMGSENWSRISGEGFWFTMLLTIVLSITGVYCIEAPIKSIRANIRKKSLT
jgi:peptidoglycan/LPS O-acetylase OafA/YrhL